MGQGRTIAIRRPGQPKKLMSPGVPGGMGSEHKKDTTFLQNRIGRCIASRVCNTESYGDQRENAS